MSKKEIKVLGIVPARGGSKSIPHKNIALLAGKPLIYYTIKSAQKSRKLDAFIVSTDDEKIACVARSLGADVPFLRPKNISGDNATDIQFLKHALAWLGKNRNWYPEIVVLLRPTTPLRTSKDIDEVMDCPVHGSKQEEKCTCGFPLPDFERDKDCPVHGFEPPTPTEPPLPSKASMDIVCDNAEFAYFYLGNKVNKLIDCIADLRKQMKARK